MDAYQTLKWVNALGFPISVSGVLLWGFWKIGTRLLDSHAAYLVDTATATKRLAETTAENMKEQRVQSSELSKQTNEQIRQTVILSDLKLAMPSVCQARCPDSDTCDNYKPKKQ